MATTQDSTLDWSDPAYREAVIDLLGAMAYGELQAYERLASDGAMAPDFYNRTAIAEMATAEFKHFKMLRDRLEQMGADPEVAMTPFVEPIDAFHASTAPADWLEGLVKAYVGDGIAMDFYRDVAVHLDPETRDLINEVCSDLGHSKFVVDAVQYCVAEDPRVAGRLALWGRRLMGEAVAQSQRVASQRESLIDLVLGGIGPDMAAITRMFADLTEAHTARMQSLGLEA
jgi:ferritin-like protein